MAQTVKTNSSEVFEIEPARPAVMGVREVVAYDLTLTQDEANSLATLLHCHVGGLQRSPSLQALLRALEDAGANMNARELIARDTTHMGLTVLADLFGVDKAATARQAERENEKLTYTRV